MNLSQLAESDARREEAQLIRERHHAALIAPIVCRIWQGRTRIGPSVRQRPPRFSNITESVGCLHVPHQVVPGTFVDYAFRTTWYQLVCTRYEPAPKIRICRYLCTRATSPQKKRTEGLLMKLLQKNKKKINNLNTELCHHRPRSKAHCNEYDNNADKAE